MSLYMKCNTSNINDQYSIITIEEVIEKMDTTNPSVHEPIHPSIQEPIASSDSSMEEPTKNTNKFVISRRKTPRRYNG